MGSWNGTCGLTQLPIRNGDEVIVYLLRSRIYKDCLADGGLCYSTDLCQPIFFGINAQYNDYGGIKKAEKVFNSELILQWANNSLAIGNKEKKSPEKPVWLNGVYVDEIEIRKNNERAKQCEDKYDDKRLRHSPIDKFASIEDLLKAVERGRITFGDMMASYPITYMMIRKDVHDAIIKIVMEDANPYYRKHHPIKQLIEDAQNLLEWICNGPEKLSGNWGLGSEKLNNNFEKLNSISRIIGGGNGYEMSMLYQILISHFENKKNDNKAFDCIKNKLIEYSLLSEAMKLMRKLWMPQSGAGSQNTEFELFKSLAQAVIEITNKEIKKQEDLNE